jgi:hypothetical protein
MNLHLDQLRRCARPGCHLHTEPGTPFCPGHTPGGSFRPTNPRTPAGRRANPKHKES